MNQTQILDWIKRVAVALKLADADGTLSLTNVAMMTVIAKLALMQQPDLATLGALFLAIANYNAKKFNVFKHKQADAANQEQSDADKVRIDSIESEVKALASAFDLRKLGR